MVAAVCALLIDAADAKARDAIPRDVGLLLASAQTAIAEDRHEDAKAAIDEAMGVRLLAPNELGVALYLRGQALYELGDARAAAADWSRALEEGDLPVGQAAALQEAIARVEDHLHAAESFDGDEGVAAAFLRQAQEALANGHPDRAAEPYERALKIFEAAGDVRGQAIALGGLGYVALARREWKAAGDYLGRALAAAEEARMPRPMIRELVIERAHALFEDAVSVSGDADNAEAEQALLAALAHADEGVSALPRLDILVSLGFLAFDRGDLDAAADYYSRALAQADRLGNRRLSSAITAALALVERARGDLPAAEGLLESLRSGAEAAGEADLGARALEEVAITARSAGEHDAACWMEGRARDLYLAAGLDDDAEDMAVLMEEAGCAAGRSASSPP